MTKKEHRTLIRIIVTLIWFAALLGTDRAGLLRGAGTYGRFLLYFLPYLLIGYDVLLKALRNIIRGQVFDEHFLMMIATFAAFGLGLMGDEAYSEALAVMLFYQIGELFQDVAVGKSRKSIADMMSIAPESANVERNGRVEVMDPEEAHIGDILLIKAGEKVPLDGTVIEGESYLNTAALTGESVPRRVKAGDPVISSCVNGEGTLRVRVEKEYEDSTVARILDLVENASSRKARLENFITRFARVYTPVVTIGACNFLIVSCPCALVISVPLGFFGGIGASSKIGVLVKGSNYLEAASGLSMLVFDKTGTLTRGEFRVQKVVPAAGESGAQKSLGTPEEKQRRLLEAAALGEGYSNHPIARSIREALGEETNLDSGRVTDVRETAGHGIEALLDEKKLLIGNLSLMTSHHIDVKPASEAGTIIYVALDGRCLGYIVISDTVKEGAKEAIREIKEAGVSKTVMLTGDRKGAAVQVAETLGIDEVHSDLLPADKVSEVEKLIAEAEKNGGKLGFVGDGINDAPVLMRADVGFAMGALGSDAAIEAADIVLMDDDIRKIPKVIRIARKTMRIVRSNVVFAIAVKLLILALSVFGLASMWAAVFGDVGVAILCILNSMRTLHESR